MKKSQLRQLIREMIKESHSPAENELRRLGIKYELSGNKYKPFKKIFKPINKSDDFYKNFDDVVDRYNLGSAVVTKSSSNLASLNEGTSEVELVSFLTWLNDNHYLRLDVGGEELDVVSKYNPGDLLVFLKWLEVDRYLNPIAIGKEKSIVAKYLKKSEYINEAEFKHISSSENKIKDAIKDVEKKFRLKANRDNPPQYAQLSLNKIMLSKVLGREDLGKEHQGAWEKLKKEYNLR